MKAHHKNIFKLDASFFLEKSSLATSMSKVADETIYAY